MHGQFGHGALAVIQQRPGVPELHRVMGIAEQFQRQAAHDALRGNRRKSAVFGKQAGSFQRRQGVASVTRGAQLHAQCQGTPRSALRQLAQPLKGRARITVFQSPARSAKQHAFAHFLRLTRVRVLQGKQQVLLAQGFVLQRLRTFSHQQVRQ